MALTERIISTPNEIDRLIKARIEELRKKEKGLTQEKFAQRAGIPGNSHIFVETVPMFETQIKTE